LAKLVLLRDCQPSLEKLVLILAIYLKAKKAVLEERR
jgi:hypothetical protein